MPRLAFDFEHLLSTLNVKGDFPVISIYLRTERLKSAKFKILNFSFVEVAQLLFRHNSTSCALYLFKLIVKEF